MDLTIDIIDTKDGNVTLSLEKALARSIILDWKGTDRIDNSTLIGCALSFTMVGLSCEDGQYFDLFTGDETRYRVRLYNGDNQTLYNGFLLPDFYDEPYQDSPIPVKFEAVDGIGRIKGKYLPQDFYKEEKSVIEIISQCLLLTGLGLDFRFAPAIENTLQKDYNLIYIDTSYFSEKEKRQDAYKILEDLLKSMGCVLFQAENYWNIEGLNVRQRRVYTTKIYSPSGEFLESVEVTRLYKEITALATPHVRLQPPYGLINIDHEREPTAFADTIYQEENDGWVNYSSAFSYVYATDWIGRNGFYANGLGKERDIEITNVYFTRRIDNELEQYISIRKQPYLQKGKKYKLNLNFEIEPFLWLGEGFKETLIEGGIWTNPFIFEVNINYNTFFNNTDSLNLFNNTDPNDGTKYKEQAFNGDFESKNTFYFIPNQSGLLDIKIFPLDRNENEDGNWGPLADGILAIKIANLTIEDLGFEETYLTEKTLTEDFTLKKEQTLLYADDATGQSKGFRLMKLKDRVNFESITIPFLVEILFQGKYYYTVSLAGANLIKDNIETVLNNGNTLTGIDVIYNWKNGQEHVVESDFQLTGDFVVQVFDFNSVTENRDYWEQWTDSLYKIEKLRYPETLLNIYSRLFDKSLITIPDLTVKNNIKINDFIAFNYRGKKGFVLPNCKWDLHRGYSTLAAVQNYYAIEEGVNIPPIVEAGNNIYIDEDSELTTIYSEGYDPDGFIVSYLWEEVTNNGASILNKNGQSTVVTGLTKDFYTFRVTVTDNGGATSSDTVNVYRIQDAGISLVTTFQEQTATVRRKNLIFQVTPEISEGEAVNITGKLTVSHKATNAEIKSSMTRLKIKRGNVYIQELEIRGPGNKELIEDFSIFYVKGEVITVELYAEWVELINIGDNHTLDYFSRIEVENAQFIDGLGNITGTPIMEQVIYP